MNSNAQADGSTNELQINFTGNKQKWPLARTGNDEYFTKWKRERKVQLWDPSHWFIFWKWYHLIKMFGGVRLVQLDNHRHRVRRRWRRGKPIGVIVRRKQLEPTVWVFFRDGRSDQTNTGLSPRRPPKENFGLKSHTHVTTNYRFFIGPQDVS